MNLQREFSLRRLLLATTHIASACACARAATVVSVADPYSAFGVGELADTKFILFSDDPTYWEISLSLSAAGTKTLGAGGSPRIGQSGDAGSLLGLTDVTSAFIATYDKGVAFYDNGFQDGRNAILMQSSGASGDMLQPGVRIIHLRLCDRGG